VNSAINDVRSAQQRLIEMALSRDAQRQGRKLRDDYRTGVVELLAPDVFPVEFAHAVTRAERARRITQVEGAQSMIDMLAFLPALHDSLPILRTLLEVSHWGL
jgi:hypothetical protein